MRKQQSNNSCSYEIHTSTLRLTNYHIPNQSVKKLFPKDILNSFQEFLCSQNCIFLSITVRIFAGIMNQYVYSVMAWIALISEFQGKLPEILNFSQGKSIFQETLRVVWEHDATALLSYESCALTTHNSQINWNLKS